MGLGPHDQEHLHVVEHLCRDYNHCDPLLCAGTECRVSTCGSKVRVCG